MKGSFALLNYIYKIAERVWYVVKHLGVENMLMRGGIKNKVKNWNHLEQRGGTNQPESKCILWRLLRFGRSEQLWRLCGDLVDRDKFSFFSVSVISSNQERNKWSCGKQLSCWLPASKWKQTGEPASENIQGANSWHQLWWHPAQLSLILRSRVFYCNTRFSHLYCSQRWDQMKYKFLVEMTTLGQFKTARQSGENIKAHVLVSVLVRNPRGRNWKELITGPELFASDLVNCFALIIVFPFWNRAVSCVCADDQASDFVW